MAAQGTLSVQSLTKTQKFSVFACPLATSLAIQSKQQTGLILGEPLLGPRTTVFWP